jgi:hypothetical protein
MLGVYVKLQISASPPSIQLLNKNAHISRELVAHARNPSYSEG